MEIVYNSKAGSVSFGGNGNFTFALTGVAGLWLTGRKFNTVTYAGVPGQITTDVSESARTITLSGDINMGEDAAAFALSQALAAFHYPGELIFYLPNRVYKIDCRCSAADQGDRNGMYQKYVFQFVCDDPYFSDVSNTVAPLYKIVGLLNAAFTFPGVFSTATIGGSVYYTGTAETEPIIRIHVNSAPEAYPDNGFAVENETTGQRIQLDYEPASGDVITIDVPNRRIYKDDGTDLIRYISDGTFLNGFKLVPGENQISANSYNVTADVYMECIYKNKYLEGAW